MVLWEEGSGKGSTTGALDRNDDLLLCFRGWRSALDIGCGRITDGDLENLYGGLTRNVEITRLCYLMQPQGIPMRHLLLLVTVCCSCGVPTLSVTTPPRNTVHRYLITNFKGECNGNNSFEGLNGNYPGSIRGRGISKTVILMGFGDIALFKYGQSPLQLYDNPCDPGALPDFAVLSVEVIRWSSSCPQSDL